jgi:hypothetical protein
MDGMQAGGTYMKRWITSMLAILSIVFLAESQVSVNIGGIDGKSLLKNMDNGSLNLTGNNNTTGNFSAADNLKAPLHFLGNGGKVPVKNLTNSSLNLTGKNNTTSDLATWGGKPLAPPPMPDFSDYQTAQIIKENRVE